MTKLAIKRRLSLKRNIGLGAALQSAGGSPVLPTLVSAAIRSTIPQSAGSTQNIGTQVATNGLSYTQYQEQSVKNLKGIRPIYSNITTTSYNGLRSDIDNAGQEQGSCNIGIRFQIIKGIAGTTADQTGASSFYTGRFSDAANDLGFTVGATTYPGCLWKLSYAFAVPTMTVRTYAQFVADGGSIVSSTVDGVSLPNSLIYIPRNYDVIADAGPDVTALEPYYCRIEDDVPVVTITSVDGTTAGTAIFYTSATGRVTVGDVAVAASGTGNTSVNGVWQVSAVNPNVSITLNTVGSTAGAVGGTPTLRFMKPAGQINNRVGSGTNGPSLGDYNRASATRRDVMGANGANWLTGVGANIAGDGGVITGFAAILGTDMSGGINVGCTGDSQLAGVRDGINNLPTDQLAGDAVGNMGFFARAAYVARLPTLRTQVPGMKDKNAYTKRDNAHRMWLLGFCDYNQDEMGRNDGLDGDAFSVFENYKITAWTRNRAAMRGAKKVIGTTLSPSTQNVGGDNLKTGRSSAYQLQVAGAFRFPDGYIYANYHAKFYDGTYVTHASGGLDGYIDQAQLASNLGPGAAPIPIDGAFAVDGVNAWHFCVDFSHFSGAGHTGIAAQLNANSNALLKAAGYPL